MVDFTMKVGDLLPTFDVTLKDGGSDVDLSTGVGSVLFYMRDSDGTLKINNGSASLISAGSTGLVRYTWASGNTNTADDYTAEFIVAWTTGNKPQTFPNTKDLKIRIINDVE